MLRSSLINFFHQTVLLVQNSGYFGSLISSKKGDASSQWLSGPMFELRMGQYRLYRDDRHRENAPHFIVFSLNNLGHYWGPIKIARVHAGTFMRDSFEIGLFPPYSSCHFRVKISPNPHSMGHMFFGLQWSLETISLEIMGEDGVDRHVPWNDLNLTNWFLHWVIWARVRFWVMLHQRKRRRFHYSRRPMWFRR